jgi:MutS domain V
VRANQSAISQRGSVSDPKAEYSRRLDSYLQISAAKNRLHIQIGNLKLAIVATGLVVAYLTFGRHLFNSEWLWAPIAAYAILSWTHQRVIRARSRAETAAAMYRRGIARIEDRWAGTGQPGDRFRDPEHVYADDLDLFGRGGLFDLLSTARLPMGENRLADWLKSPGTRAAILERQKIVAELRDKLDLRHDLAVIGEEVRTRFNPESLVGWAEAKREMPGAIWHFAAVFLALAFIGSFAWSIAYLNYWPVLCVLVIEIIFRRALHHRAHHVNEGVSCNAEGLVLFADVLQRLEREPLSSARLQSLIAQLGRDGTKASRSIRQLAQIEYWIDAHHSLIGHLLELPLLYSIQTAFLAEAWRRRHGARMRASVDTVGEIEALLSLATYSYEHPADPFPEFVDPTPTRLAAQASKEDSRLHGFFDGVDLGHPLIAAANCVRNSVRLDDATRVLLVSGSNMSGKSTFLRSVGINTVLAMAGAPVRAKSLRLSPLQVGTRIHSSDSLQEGRSTFFAEILHIRRVFDLATTKNSDNAATDLEPRALLFLFDELLEGTNSKDRRIGAERLIQGLLERSAVGIVTTHDLALTEITAAVGDVIRNVHFEDQIEGNEMRFDYRLRDGVVTKSNAIALMRIIGLDM